MQKFQELMDEFNETLGDALTVEPQMGPDAEPAHDVMKKKLQGLTR